MIPYYDEDGITIYHGDCRDVLPLIDPASVSLVLTDPPYGIGWDTGYSLRGMSQRTQSHDYPPVYGDDEPFDPAPLLRFGRCILFGANNYADKLPPSSGWGMLKDSERTEKRVHPTQKPVALMRWLLGRWSEPDDLILDPYMGSGPVAQACSEMHRRYVGVEMSERYCEIAVKRLAQGVLAI